MVASRGGGGSCSTATPKSNKPFFLHLVMSEPTVFINRRGLQYSLLHFHLVPFSFRPVALPSRSVHSSFLSSIPPHIPTLPTFTLFAQHISRQEWRLQHTAAFSSLALSSQSFYSSVASLPLDPSSNMPAKGNRMAFLPLASLQRSCPSPTKHRAFPFSPPTGAEKYP